MPAMKLYVEGGGESNALRTACRQGFRQFLENAGLTGKMPRIVACGSRNDAYDSFCTALRHNRNELSILLVDSEAFVAFGDGKWTHLYQRDNWQQPQGAGDNHVYLMVQCLETWFIADADTMADYFGQYFNRNSLPRNPDSEAVPKEDISRALENATRRTNTGPYNKGSHSFELLGRINVDAVQNRCPHAQQFVDFLLENR